MIWLMIGVGAGTGALCRYTVTMAGKRWWPERPIATMLINIAGAFAAGLVSGWAPLPVLARSMLLVGVCGGFTTFSTFAVDMAILLRNRRWSWTVVYAAGSVALGLLAAWLGLLLTAYGLPTAGGTGSGSFPPLA